MQRQTKTAPHRRRPGKTVVVIVATTIALVAAAITGLIATTDGSGERNVSDDPASVGGPEEVAVDYLSSLIDGDCEQAELVMSSDAPAIACRYLRPPDGMNVSLGKPVETSFDGDQATVTIALKVIDSHQSNGDNPQQKKVSYQLVREDDDWKIAGPTAANDDATARTTNAPAASQPTSARLQPQGQRATQVSAVSGGTLRWLALGDSYSSGEGTLAAEGDCQRSATAYAPVAHKLLDSADWDVRFDDPKLLACTGARINGNPDSVDLVEQMDAAAARRYDLITLTIGGNDVGFAGIITQCLAWGCAAESDLERDVDTVGSSLSHIYGRLVDEHLAPGGHIIVLGYPRLFEDSETWPVRGRHGTSFPTCEGVLRADADMLGRVSDRLNNVIRKATAQHADVSYLPAGDAFEGHRLCTSVPGHQPWINGIDLATSRIENWFHPNANGHAAEARRLARHISELHWPAPIPQDEDGVTCTRQPDGDVICRATD